MRNLYIMSKKKNESVNQPNNIRNSTFVQVTFIHYHSSVREYNPFRSLRGNKRDLHVFVDALDVRFETCGSISTTKVKFHFGELID